MDREQVPVLCLPARSEYKPSVFHIVLPGRISFTLPELSFPHIIDHRPYGVFSRRPIILAEKPIFSPQNIHGKRDCIRSPS